MPFLVNKTPAQRNKLILAIVLGSVALFFLQRVFFNSSSSNRAARRPRPAGTRTNSPPSNRSGAPAPTTPQQRRDDPLVAPQPIDYHWRPPAAPPVGRNICAYYIAPTPTPTPAPTPSPTPPPSLILAAVAPSSVYARTGDFRLELTGEKFTPATRVVLDERVVPTRFVSAQHLSASVPAALVAAISIYTSRQRV